MSNPVVQKGARKISNAGSKKVTGYFNSIKNALMIPFESSLEMDVAYYLEYYRQVLRYAYQPFKLNYELQGKRRTYTPDADISVKFGPSIVGEIKPKEMLERLDWAKFGAVEEAIASLGSKFKFITDQAIRVEPKLTNLKMLYSYAHAKVAPEVTTKIVDCLNYLGGQERLQKIIDTLAPEGIGLNVVYHQIFHHFLVVDINQKITSSTVISLDNNAEEELPIWLQ